MKIDITEFLAKNILQIYHKLELHPSSIIISRKYPQVFKSEQFSYSIEKKQISTNNILNIKFF